ncbi:MAG: T9SS type A sorting domain-containing protein [Ignavibacteriales bacterium]|nr:T9SS type A sorting domain-containing protein [Ignavibacteriales bacterium]
MNTGLPNVTIQSRAVSGKYIFAATDGYGVWRRPLSDMVTSVERLSTDLPTHFSLEQNYPNPFNPSTKIQFSIPNASFVSLKVFNVLGAEIATLVNENKAAGTYQVTWDGNGYPSGVYLYCLIGGGKVFTGKMNLLK